MHLDLRRDALPRALHPDAAVEVVEHRGDDQHDEERRERPSHRELEERQPEHVEPDVLAELRILLAEVDRVPEQDPAAPLGGDAAAHDQREEQRDQHAQATRVGRDVRAVALDDLVFGPGRRAVARRDPVRDDEVDEQHDEEDRREDQRGDRLGREEPAPRVAEPDLLEPEVVGVEAREAAQAQESNDEDDRSADQPAA